MTAREPVCGRPMRRYEPAGIAVLEDPVCGRKPGHYPPCRSEAAISRAREAGRARRRDIGHPERECRREAQQRAARVSAPGAVAELRMVVAILSDALQERARARARAAARPGQRRARRAA